MSDRPIIFSAPMVNALLAGRKTQTRRILKPQPAVYQPQIIDITAPDQDEDGLWGQTVTAWGWDGGIYQPESETWRPLKGLHYRVGDRLWVRETWGSLQADAPGVPDGRKAMLGDKLVYRANPADAAQWGAGLPSQGAFVWRSSIYQPRFASRLTLTVTDVRVQRLQEISAEDADAEVFGGDFPHQVMPELFSHPEAGSLSIPECFGRLWNSLHGPDAWDANPFVVGITFTVDRRNIDAPA